MKKLVKVLAVTAVASCCAGAMAFAGCADEVSVKDGTYTGEYHYANPYNAEAPHYGVKVNVSVKDNKITDVVIDTSANYVVVTDSWANKEVWNNGIEALLDAYNGKTVTEIKKQTVAKAENGTPESQQVKDEETEEMVANPKFVAYDSDLLINGATQGSSRLLLAVQNAIENALK